MNQPIPSVRSTADKPTNSDTRRKPRPVRVAGLLNAVPILCALNLVMASIGPKLPASKGD